MNRITCRWTATVLAVSGLLTLVGCFESVYPVAPNQPGNVDRRFIGDWLLERRNDDGQLETSRLIVRNLHNNEYYIEWQSGGDAPFRASGWLSRVGRAQFASLLPLTDDGSVAEKYTILRLDPDDTGFEIRVLDADFFSDRAINSSDGLRAILEQNLDNDRMYEGEPFVATREQ